MVTSVLVVDDDQQIRDLIGALLLDDRISLEYASTRQTGASLLQTRRFDLAILDAMLSDHPEPDLAALAANENTPILFMTRDSTDARIREQASHCFIEKKFIRDHLPEQFARILLQTRQNPPGAIPERHDNRSISQMLVAEETAGIPQGVESHEPAAPITTDTARSGLTGHLGTLVRHRRLATYEVRFSLEDDRIVVIATRASKPVSLDFNATVRELVLIGQTIFTHSAWSQNHGTLVRTP